VPTYQYRCTACEHAFEQFQSFTDDALTVCPECGGRLRKVFNAVGVVFKGSGFYRNDSRSTSSTAGPTKTETADTSGAASKDSNGSDSSTSASGDSSSTGSSGSDSSGSSSSSPSSASTKAGSTASS
jgi:putative FmdB family regulatory protein